MLLERLSSWSPFGLQVYDQRLCFQMGLFFLMWGRHWIILDGLGLPPFSAKEVFTQRLRTYFKKHRPDASDFNPSSYKAIRGLIMRIVRYASFSGPDVFLYKFWFVTLHASTITMPIIQHLPDRLPLTPVF